jgi:hypothetical protein
MSVGEPISTAGMTIRQTDELNIRLRAAIEQLREEVISDLTATASE